MFSEIVISRLWNCWHSLCIETLRSSNDLSRCRRNTIFAIRVGENVGVVREEIMRFLSHQTAYDRPTIDNIQISDQDKLALTAPFCPLEIEVMVL